MCAFPLDLETLLHELNQGHAWPDTSTLTATVTASSENRVTVLKTFDLLLTVAPSCSSLAFAEAVYPSVLSPTEIKSRSGS